MPGQVLSRWGCTSLPRSVNTERTALWSVCVRSVGLQQSCKYTWNGEGFHHNSQLSSPKDTAPLEIFALWGWKRSAIKGHSTPFWNEWCCNEFASWIAIGATAEISSSPFHSSKTFAASLSHIQHAHVTASSLFTAHLCIEGPLSFLLPLFASSILHYLISFSPLIRVFHSSHPHSPDHDLSVAGCPSHCTLALSLPTHRMRQAHTSAFPVTPVFSSCKPVVCQSAARPCRHSRSFLGPEHLPVPVQSIRDPDDLRRSIWSDLSPGTGHSRYLWGHLSLLCRPLSHRRFPTGAEAEQLWALSSLPELTSKGLFALSCELHTERQSCHLESPFSLHLVAVVMYLSIANFTLQCILLSPWISFCLHLSHAMPLCKQ